MNQEKSTLFIAWLLIASGLIHLLLWVVSGGDWEGAVSLRKPALFGISGGLTIWSLLWVLTCIHARAWERVASRLVAGCLLIEVALITLQYWRGVPSHFNESTLVDTCIERTMLALITLATLWIAWLCVRVMGPIDRSPAMTLAIRAGMLALLVSCLLGFATTWLGKWNLIHGQPYGVWGRAGVLKFPHGIALHAIQFLPMVAWFVERYRWREPISIVRGLVAAQLWLVAFAIYQTLDGRARTDVGLYGGFLLAAATVSAAIPFYVLRKVAKREVAVPSD